MSDPEWLLNPETIRFQAKKIFVAMEFGETNFFLDDERWNETVDIVWKEMNRNYPSLDIPFHSRLRHFDIGHNRLYQIEDQSLENLIDLCCVSVLIDAGAGDRWRYRYKDEKESFGKSEGLALASLEMFEKGFFGQPFEVSADTLVNLELKDFKTALQISDDNPIDGLEGRFNLLKNFGKAIKNNEFFKGDRPSSFLQSLDSKSIEAKEFLNQIIMALKTIWPQGDPYKGDSLGDVWYYPPFGERDNIEAYIPFHKLPQWLTYSLLEIFMKFDYEVEGICKMTGLAEYRNGGLFIDSGLLLPNSIEVFEKKWSANSPLIIEWRAITLVLLDKLHKEIVERLKLTPELFPLVKTLEGGTWKAGRRLAQEKRNGLPPLDIIRDGTVF